jgi:hypothetical protein
MLDWTDNESAAKMWVIWLLHLHAWYIGEASPCVFLSTGSQTSVIPKDAEEEIWNDRKQESVYPLFRRLISRDDRELLTSSLIATAQAWQNTKADGDRRQLIAAASKLVEDLEIQAETLTRIGWGEPSRTAARQTAFELGLLEKLGDLPQTSQTLAEGTPADSALVGMIVITWHCNTELMACRTHTKALGRLLSYRRNWSGFIRSVQIHALHR